MTNRLIQYSLRSASPAKTRAEAVVIGIVQDDKTPKVAEGGEDVAAAYGRKWRGLLATLGATGKRGEVTRIPSGETLASPLLVLVGLGKDATAASVRYAAGEAARAIPNATSVALALPADSTELIRSVTEGHRLGGYAFTQYKSTSEDAPSEAIVLSSIARQAEASHAFEEAQVVADAVAGARTWVNIPPGDFTPPVFADEIVAAAEDIDALTVTVHDEKSLAKLGCGGILGVGKGSDAPPRLVEMSYEPDGATRHLALVGKGITFDSGGLSIKPAQSMTTMKSDMHGAASVAQAALAIAKLGLPIRVSTFVPMAENMVSGRSLKPGDIVTHYGGTTTEAQNTDAEGRLILADALVRATETEADVILDVATLTGAMVVALGERISGVMGSDEIVDQVIEASKGAGEEMWPLPLPDSMTERVKSSKIADLAQVDWIRWGGGLYAGAFLREFTDGRPWAHLDIAGPSFNSGGARGHETSGATGVAVTTLVEYARRHAVTTE